MFTEFSATYDEASQWTWADWQPYFDELETIDLSADNIEAWLQQQTLIGQMVTEIGSRNWIAVRANTNDETASSASYRFATEISPYIEKSFAVLNAKLIESDLAPDAMRVPLRNLKALNRLYNEDNQPLFVRLNQLNQDYNKLYSAQMIEWDGDTIHRARLSQVLKDTNRERSKEAWILTQERIKQDRDAYDELWRHYMNIRGKLAKNAGFDDYRQYAWLQRFRHDYTPDDALQFVEAIREVVVPVQERLHEQRRGQLGYDTLRPWDLNVDPIGRDPLQPSTNITDFIEKTEVIFHHVDAELGAIFITMKKENLLDLEQRVNKAGGGITIDLPHSKRAFIMMDATNSEDDVIMLLHESGHAFHLFAQYNNLDYTPQMWTPTEFSEVAAMAMELLASSYLTKEHGGYFTEKDAARFRANHLREFIRRWLWADRVAFQHWVYTNHDEASDPANCDAKWCELTSQFHRGVDWRGYEDYCVNGWRTNSLILQNPFYMIEYCLAQLGAVQIYANALQNQTDALKQYRNALALGGTVTLPELYEAAGAKLAFDAETLKPVVDLVERQIKHFDGLVM